MDILKFRVRGQALTLTNPNVNLIPVTDTVNQYLCQFEFSEDWDDLNKVVVFKNVSYNISKEVYLSTSNECYIPWEVLSNSGDIFLEVIGTEVRGEVVTVRIPSTLLGFKWEIQEGLLDVSANVSPTPDLFEQFVSSVREDSIVAATARDEAVIARDVSVQSAADASASELAATSAAESAVNSASTASSAASSASESALSVAGVADETKSYAEIASSKAVDASTQAEIAAGAKEDAVIAKAGAEAARDEAVTSADLAQTTESHIKTMTVSAHSLAETEAPTVTKTDTSTGFALDFGIPKGATGPKGEDGDNIHYTWVKYADTPTSGMSDDPTGKAYIGIAYNKSTPVGSTVYSDYAWSCIKGEAGEDGYSPTVITGTASDGSTTLTVTNKDGSTTTTLADGKARADIANLEIGGRNLLTNPVTFIEDGVVLNGIIFNRTSNPSVWKIKGTATSKVKVSLIGFTATTNPTKSTILLKEGQTYTESVKIEGSLPDNAYIGVSISNSSGAFLSEFALNSTTAKSHTFTATAAQYALRYWTVSIPSGESVDCTIYLKFEIGDKATDWTPAPEDVDAAIANTQENIDNIEIGGRNLFIETDYENIKTQGSASACGWYSVADIKARIVNDNSEKAAKISASSWDLAQYVNVEAGETYTMSCFARLETERSGAKLYFKPDVLQSYYREFDKELTTDYQKFTYTWTCGVGGIERIHIRAGDANDVSYIKKIKFEKGNKATDWTPALEDVLPIKLGGTGATTASDARTNLGLNKNIITSKPSEDVTRSGTGDSKIPVVKANSVGDKFTVTSGSVYVGSGISKVLVSAHAKYQCTTGIKNLAIRKNGTAIAEINQNANFSSNLALPFAITPVLIDVTEGDYFELYWYGATNDVMQASLTRMTIEAVE